MFTEDMGPKQQARAGYAKDVAEVESYVRGFSRRRPDVTVTTLRAANVIGPLVNSPIVSYFRLPVIPTVLGFDARLQFLHEHDLLGAIQHATLNGVHGTFNVAGDGLIMLSQAIRRIGRPSLKLPTFAVASFGSAIRQVRLADFSPEQVQFLTYGRGVDTTRMRTVLDYHPRYTTQEAFADFGTALAPGLLSAERVAAAEEALTGALSPSGRLARHTTTIGGDRA